MVKAFAKFANLNDHVEFMVFKPLHYELIGPAVLSRMYVVGTTTTGAVGFYDLNTVLLVECRGDDLEPVFSRYRAAFVQFAN